VRNSGPFKDHNLNNYQHENLKTYNECLSVRIHSQVQDNVIIRMVCTLAVMVAFHVAADIVPTSDVRLFYGCQFILHAVKPFLLFIGIPRVARLLKPKQH
jgi:hypothetical protein